MSMHLCVFDVGRGLCCAVRSPNGHLIMIDCGKSDEFSPVEALAKASWTEHRNCRLTYLIVSHPHVDHLADIENVTAHFPPYMIHRRRNLNQAKVTSGGSGVHDAFVHFSENYMPPKYMADIPEAERPIWGDNFVINSYSLPEKELDNISKTDNSYANNSSFVTVIKYRGYTFVLTGDIESEGMAHLLGYSGALRQAVESSGVNFLIAPHHGHTSGFSPEWFDIAGPTKQFNIASERRMKPGESEGQTKIDPRYSDPKYSSGHNREKRRMVSTKSDGTLLVSVDDNGKWEWQAYGKTS